MLDILLKTVSNISNHSLTCDYLGRKTAIVFTTLMIVIGGILAAAAHGVTIYGMFWMMTVARGVVGFGTSPPNYVYGAAD